MKFFKDNKDYNVGLYLRLSKEDGDRLESESISNQRSILQRYCKEHGFNYYKEYIDDGYSGLNFDRPGFKEMIKDIECGNIDMIITKDLARFGRDYSGVGMYIERYFPENNIRFKTVLDDIDTIKEIDDMVPVEAVMNDLYCKEASRKFRAMLYNKKKDGMYISVEPPYGYKKDPEKKGHLIIDEVESSVVKRIFNLYLSGKGTYQIQRILNAENIPIPSINRKNITSITNKWHRETIKNILKKEVYVGDTVLGKTKKINYKSKKIIKLPESEWIITKNTHEPIISRSDFEIVQKMLNNNKSTKIVKHDYLLRGIVKCKDCGNNITWITKKDKYKDKVTIRKYGVCSKALRDVAVEKCIRKYINYNETEKLILTGIYSAIQIYLNKIDFKKIVKYEQTLKEEKINEAEEKVNYIKEKIENVNSKIDRIYMDKLDNVINKIDFTRISEKLIIERENLQEILKEKEHILEDVKKIEDIKVSNSKIKKMLNDFCKLETVTKQDLLKLVDKVYIDSNKKIEIVFRFKELNIISDKL